MHSPGPGPALAVLAVIAVGFAACSTGGGSIATAGSASGPAATAIANPVSSPEDAADRVIASDPRFKGATMLLPESIGLTKWWEWTALDNGGYEIRITIGSGDCPAGCIERHTWTFDVAEDGTLTAVGESGDPLPPGAS